MFVLKLRPSLLNDFDGKALSQAVSEGSLERCEHLLLTGAKVNQTDSNGWPPLCLALSSGHVHIARFLLESGADVNVCNPYGVSALTLATALDDDTLSLIHDRMTPEFRRGHNDSALMLACLKGHYSSALWLLTNDSALIQVNAISTITGVSALHLAVIGGHRKLVELLLVFGADPKICSVTGQTGLEFARRQNPPDPKLLRLLGQVGASKSREKVLKRCSIQPKYTVNNILLDVGGNVVLRNSPTRPVFDDDLRTGSEIRELLSPSIQSVFFESPSASSTPVNACDSQNFPRYLPIREENQGSVKIQQTSRRSGGNKWSVQDDLIEKLYSAGTDPVFEDGVLSPGLESPRKESKSSFFSNFFLTPLKNSIQKSRKRGRNQMETPRQGFTTDDTPAGRKVRKLSGSLHDSISFNGQTKDTSVDFNEALVYSQSPNQFTSPITNYRLENQKWTNFQFGPQISNYRQDKGERLTYNQTSESQYLTSLLSPKYDQKTNLYKRGKRRNLLYKVKWLKTLTKRKNSRSRSLDDSGGYTNFDELKDDVIDFKQLLLNHGLERFCSIFLEHELDFPTFITLKRTDLILMGIEDTKSQNRILESVEIFKQLKL